MKKDYTDAELKAMPEEERKTLFSKAWAYDKQLLTPKFVTM